MIHKGFSHIGLSTLDLDKTRAFYEGVLGFKPVVADTIKIKEGGYLRHLFFDVGRDQLIAFLEPNGVPDVPAKYDAGINRGLGVPAGFYHFAFEAGSPASLAEKRDELGEGYRGHRNRRSRMGSVDLLQGSQWPVARVLLHDAQSY
jgi:catechol 2,3-dioxygenase-like lactoylglutathione lyase family enzyme